MSSTITDITIYFDEKSAGSRRVEQIYRVYGSGWLNNIKHMIAPELLSGLSQDPDEWHPGLHVYLERIATQCDSTTDALDFAACLRIAYSQREDDLPPEVHVQDFMEARHLLSWRQGYLEALSDDLRDWFIYEAGRFELARRSNVSEDDSAGTLPLQRPHPTAPPGSTGVYPHRTPRYDGYKNAITPTSFDLTETPASLPHALALDKELSRRRITGQVTPSTSRKIDFTVNNGTPRAPKADKTARSEQMVRRVLGIPGKTRSNYEFLLQIAYEAKKIELYWQDFEERNTQIQQSPTPPAISTPSDRRYPPKLAGSKRNYDETVEESTQESKGKKNSNKKSRVEEAEEEEI